MTRRLSLALSITLGIALSPLLALSNDIQLETDLTFVRQ